jgi:hypothetical protein
MRSRRWAIAPACALIGLVVAGCAGVTSTASPTAENEIPESAAVPATSQAQGSSPAQVTPEPDESFAPASVLAPDTVAEVVTTDLVMRTLPGVSDESVILERVLQPADRLFIMDGPERATFYDWYLVQPFDDTSDASPPGWVAAASREGEAWIAAAAIDCPDADQADVLELDTFHRYELLGCFGDRQISVTVQAMGICSGYVIGDPNYTIEPAWLGVGSMCGWGREGLYLSTMQPYLEPSVGNGYPPGAERLDWYRLTGQFEHPEAQRCVLRELAGGHPQMPPAPDLTPEQVVLLCRSHFAVQNAEHIADPAG